MIEFDPTAPLPLKECRVMQHRSQRSNELYFGSIGYAAQPKADKRGQYFVRADVPESRLGLKQVHLRNEAVRDYFYFANRRRPGFEKRPFTICSASRIRLQRPVFASRGKCDHSNWKRPVKAGSIARDRTCIQSARQSRPEILLAPILFT